MNRSHAKKKAQAATAAFLLTLSGFAVAGDDRKESSDFLREAQTNRNVDPEFLDGIRRAVISSVAITKVTARDNETILKSPRFGSGFVALHKCYVLTSRHVVNRWVKVNYSSGKSKWKPDDNVSPEGYSVEVVRRTSQGPVTIVGTVLKAGTSANIPGNDIALIRLDQSSGVHPEDVLEIGELDSHLNQDVAFISNPIDWQRSTPPITTVVERCTVPKGSSTVATISASCKSAPGASGGSVIAKMYSKKRQREIWGAIGVGSGSLNNPTPASNVQLGSSGSQDEDGELMATSIKRYAKGIEETINADLANLSHSHPCRQ